MLKDIQIISNSGLPLLDFQTGDDHYQDDKVFLQAGFLTAVGNFTSEINNGELKLIETDTISFLIRQNPTYMTVFTYDSAQNDFLQEKELLEDVNSKVVANLGDKDYNPQDMSKEENLSKIENINKYISSLELKDAQNNKFLLTSSQIMKKAENLLFSVVGYVPGQCNIGKEGRYLRLTLGLVSIIVSLSILLIMIILDLPRQYRALLYFLNVGAFVGILQYYHEFCVYNATRKEYSMV